MGGTPERAAIDRSYQETMDILLIIAACLAAPIIPLSLVMRNYKLDAIDQKVRGKVIGKEKRGLGGGGDGDGPEMIMTGAGEGGGERGFWGRFRR